jgi:hypothetical protein
MVEPAAGFVVGRESGAVGKEVNGIVDVRTILSMAHCFENVLLPYEL